MVADRSPRPVDRASRRVHPGRGLQPAVSRRGSPASIVVGRGGGAFGTGAEAGMGSRRRACVDVEGRTPPPRPGLVRPVRSGTTVVPDAVAPGRPVPEVRPPGRLRRGAVVTGRP